MLIRGSRPAWAIQDPVFKKMCVLIQCVLTQREKFGQIQSRTPREDMAAH